MRTGESPASTCSCGSNRGSFAAAIISSKGVGGALWLSFGFIVFLLVAFYFLKKAGLKIPGFQKKVGNNSWTSTR